ncbi:uncharacterized protein C2orf81 homolog isoform X1 [Heliangelus exortis]|uniref:uncharacterized protein C2orf81 homolog isoform X1 n=1 Tax=Heliangelus exortis TaxID=472823 RepID=UPI003A911D5F
MASLRGDAPGKGGERCRGNRDASCPVGGMAERPTPRERAASRPRVERSRPPPAPTAHPTAPRRPEAEWARLLGTERGDGDVGDIVAELLDRVMEGCARASAQQQVVPATLGWARETLLLMAQMRFPARDEGDTEPGGVWQEDKEPDPPAADSWAQGFVPLMHLCLSPAEVSGMQHPPTAADAEAPPAQPPCSGQVPAAILPLTPPPEPLPERAPTAPRPPPPRPARPPPPRPAKPPQQPGDGAAEGSGIAGVLSPRPPLPPPSSRRQPPPSKGGQPKGSPSIPGVPRSDPQRWIRPRVEVLDPGGGAEPPGVTCRGWAQELGGSRQPQGLQPPSRGSLQPPRRLLRRGPGGTSGRETHIPGYSQEEEEEEEEGAGGSGRSLRPIPPVVPLPAMAAWQLTGDGER